MNKQIKWKFKGTEIYFVTAEHKMTLDVMRQRERLGINPKTKIEIVDEFITTDDSATAGCSSCGNSTNNNVQQALSMDASEDEQPGQEATLVPPMHDVLDNTDPNPTALEDGANSSSPYSGDGFVDVDVDGQVD